MRFISLMIRKLKARGEEVKTCKKFYDWYSAQQQLPPAPADKKRKLLIIRTDDIGDYILFRNSLAYYRNSAAWQGYHISLLGNIAFRDLFETFDKTSVDAAIWIDKGKYFNDADYRMETWMQLRKEGFDATICAFRTHSLLLDDLCATATGATAMLAPVNTFRYNSWNKISDNLFSSVFRPPVEFVHEFIFNMQFVNWCCGATFSLERPQFPAQSEIFFDKPYIVCFIGAATKSRRWPSSRWIEFLKIYPTEFQAMPVLSGGPDELSRSAEINGSVKVKSLINQLSLPQMVSFFQHAALVISNNTMAAHLAVACNKPVIILANGDNHVRFTGYETAGIDNVITLYPPVFHLQEKAGKTQSLHYRAVTADITGITAADVMQALRKVMPALEK